jgi:hypothetical protein
LSACLCTSGCFFGKKKTTKARVFTPPPVIAKLPPTPSDIEVVAAPPAVDAAIPTPTPPGVEIGTSLPPAPVKPAPPKPPPAKPPVTVVETPPPTPARPGAILSSQERTRLTQDYDGFVDRTRRALARVEGRSLPPDLAELAKTARNHLTLAEQERAGDLPTAVSLAERAERFAMDLLARLP